MNDGNGQQGQQTQGQQQADQQAEDKMLNDLEENMLEMRSAMYSMMSSATKTMQAFVDMRMNYLKVMREGLNDPVTTMNIVSKNLSDTATALKKERVKEAREE